MRRLVGLLLLLALMGAGHVAPAHAGGAVYEKATVLDESLRVVQRLREAGFFVGITRATDKYVSLEDRAAESRSFDLFVSIHNNGNPSRSLVGTEAYYQIGNRFGGDVAWHVVRAISKRAGTVLRGAFTRKGDDGDYYHVLRESHTTAILVEGAFLSNPDEARRLADPAFRAAIADGIVDGLVARLVLHLAPQGPGPGGNRSTVSALALPAPRDLTARYAGGHDIELRWEPLAPGAIYEVWRDGNIIGQVTDTTFTDVGAGRGRHRYHVRGRVESAAVLVQESDPAIVEGVVPWRVLIDPGHGGKDAGAIGRW